QTEVACRVTVEHPHVAAVHVGRQPGEQRDAHDELQEYPAASDILALATANIEARNDGQNDARKDDDPSPRTRRVGKIASPTSPRLRAQAHTDQRDDAHDEQATPAVEGP